MTVSLLLFALMAFVQMIPGVFNAAAESDSDVVYVGGVRLAKGERTSIFGGTASFDLQGVLTLDNVTVPKGRQYKNAAIYSLDSFTICLVGMNSVTGPDIPYDTWGDGTPTGYGILCEGLQLTIKGEGTLNVQSGRSYMNSGILMNHGYSCLTIEGNATVEVRSENALLGTAVNASTIEIQDLCTLTAYVDNGAYLAMVYGIKAKRLLIYSGRVLAKSPQSALCITEEFYMDNYLIDDFVLGTMNYDGTPDEHVVVRGMPPSFQLINTAEEPKSISINTLTTVQYEKNGGSGADMPPTLHCIDYYEVEQCTYTPPDSTKEFSHWAQGSVDGLAVMPGSSCHLIDGSTFYAIWKKKTLPVITTSNAEPLPDAMPHQSYFVSFTASGTQPITWSFGEGGTGLPEGMDFNEYGELSGRPLSSGEYTFSLVATNEVGSSAAKSFTLTVQDGVLIGNSLIKEGETWTKANHDEVIRKGTVSMNGGVLTLDNADIYTKVTGSVIRFAGNLTIHLIGDNTITDDNYTTPTESVCLNISGNLTILDDFDISHRGTLLLSTGISSQTNHGINVGGDLLIQGSASVTSKSANAPLETIGVKANRNVTLEDSAILNALGFDRDSSIGLNCYGNLLIQDNAALSADISGTTVTNGFGAIIGNGLTIKGNGQMTARGRQGAFEIKTGSPISIEDNFVIIGSIHNRAEIADMQPVVLTKFTTTTSRFFIGDQNADSAFIGKGYPVNLPATQAGYTLAAQSGSYSPTPVGGSYTFTYTADAGYTGTPVITVNDTPITLTDGKYTINNIQEAQNIAVTGLTQNKRPVKLRLMLDDEPYTGQIPYLYRIGMLPYTLTNEGNGVFTNDEIPSGTYTVYKNDTSTGVTITVTDTAIDQTINYYTVSYNTYGGTPAPIEQIVLLGQKLTVPAQPTRNPFIFDGWYKDAAKTTEWDFDVDTVTAKTTLYVKWIGTEQKMIAYSINGISGVINETAKTIKVTVPYATDLTSIIPVFTVSEGARVFDTYGKTQHSGISVQDFTKHVEYDVLAENQYSYNNDVVTYNVTVTKSTPPAPDMLTWDAVNPRQAKWRAVPGLDSYTITLFRNGVEAGTETTNAEVSSGTSYTFDEIAFEKGGAYTFKVKAALSGVTCPESAASDPIYQLNYNIKHGSIAVHGLNGTYTVTQNGQTTPAIPISERLTLIGDANEKTVSVTGINTLPLNITADGLKLSHITDAPFSLDPSVKIKLLLKGDNSLRSSSDGYAGLHVPAGASLSLHGDGSLTASSSSSAGIGGNVGESCGVISIEDCTVYAIGKKNDITVALASKSGYQMGAAESDTAIGLLSAVNRIVANFTSTNPFIRIQPIANTKIISGLSPSTIYPVVGKAITATVTPSTVVPDYQWYVNSIESVTGGTAIEGAVNSTYTPVASDAGKYLYVIAVGTGTYGGQISLTLPNAVSLAKSITAFSIGSSVGTIDETNHTIAVTMPYGTDLNMPMTPTLTHDGASISPESGVAQNFSSPVTYTVTAADGSTQAYTVTVAIALPKLLSVTEPFAMTLKNGYTTADAVINGGELPNTVNVTTENSATTFLNCAWTFPTGTYNAAPDAVNTFSWAADTAGYNVNGQIVSGNVLITNAASSAKSITAFSIGSSVGTIDETNHTIAVTMPYGTDLTVPMTPTLTHDGKSVSPESGVAQNFSSPVTYTVTAADGSTQAYTVTVAIALPKLLSVTEPSAMTLTNAYTTADAVINGGELPNTVNVTTENSATTFLNCAWTFPTGTYNAAPDAVNTFSWAADTAGYNVNGQIVSGNVLITNAAPVTEYAVSLTLTLDGGAYTGQTITLQQGAGALYPLTENGSTGVYRNASVPNGTYTIYKGGVSTEKALQVNNADGSWNLAYFTVSFDANGGTPTPASQIIVAGGRATAPVGVTRGTDTLTGWFPSASPLTAWDFAANTVTQTTTLCANWTRTPFDPPASGNTASGITAGQLFTQGETVTFTAVGSGEDNAAPIAGDFRWLPTKWETNPHGTFSVLPPHTASFSTQNMTLGTHTLTVTFVKQQYDGQAWVNVVPLTEDHKSVIFIVQRAIVVPDTGDGAMPALWLTLCLLGGAGLFVTLWKRRWA